jgi:hypothetical protein
VTKLGYGGALLNCLWVSLLLLGLAAGATVLDHSRAGKPKAASIVEDLHAERC